jgi:uncharacterized protein YdeI (BOF family)
VPSRFVALVLSVALCACFAIATDQADGKKPSCKKLEEQKGFKLPVALGTNFKASLKVKSAKTVAITVTYSDTQNGQVNCGGGYSAELKRTG